MRGARVIAITVLLLLAACDYGPPVDGGQPILVLERLNYGGSRSLGQLADAHYYELSPGSLSHPSELKAYFHWRCVETYLSPRCSVFAWPMGAAPHHQLALLPSETATILLRYYLDKGTGAESFVLQGAAQPR